MPQVRHETIAEALRRDVARQNAAGASVDTLDIDALARAVDQALTAQSERDSGSEPSEGKTPDELNSANDG